MLLAILIILAFVGVIIFVRYRGVPAGKNARKYFLVTFMEDPNVKSEILEIPPSRRPSAVADHENILQIPDSYQPVKHSQDPSILDVTGQSEAIGHETDVPLTKYRAQIPHWNHFYVYSASDIEDANANQRSFYNYFKREFLRGVLIDLEGYTNYAFILLFDLIDEYDRRGDIAKLERQIYDLGEICSRTLPYGRDLLAQRMHTANFHSGLQRLEERRIDDEYWKFGSRYRKKLNLTYEEAKLLNRVYAKSNFTDIEYCCVAVIKIYLPVLQKLRTAYQNEGTSLDPEFNRLADIVARKQFRYRSNSYNHRYAMQSLINDFYSLIFKYCENAVREKYGHKRKLHVDIYDSEVVRQEFEQKLLPMVREFVCLEAESVHPPDDATEIELNAQNTTRWKSKFQELTTSETIEPTQFLSEIKRLGNLNKRNPSAENIFFEGSKVIAKENKEIALTLYLHYLYHDLRSPKFDNKKLTKTIQKSLFQNAEQLHEFERIVSQLINDQDLERAVNLVPQIYIPKRKKIALNRAAIRDVSHKHSGTVDLLNEYLQDEFEDEQNLIISKEINSEEVQIEITQKHDVDNVALKAKVDLNQHQLELLQMFAKANFILVQEDVENFAKSRGLFRNQLIESLNEACYEILDDLLVEDDEENYLIAEAYYSLVVTYDR